MMLVRDTGIEVVTLLFGGAVVDVRKPTLTGEIADIRQCS
jgi:hypothetical protein